jgi:ribosomal protein S12 methylthiotransferase
MAIRYHLVSLGCAKNSVDSESMSVLLQREGFQSSQEPDQADILIVNTCGFIEPARQESYKVLRELAEKKKPGQLLIAAGCLTQRYGIEVAQKVEGIDAILGTRHWMDIARVIQTLRVRLTRQTFCHLPDEPSIGGKVAGIPRYAIQGASAYLKIADGCRRPCAFCAIPLIKGTAVSRPMKSILDEARDLQAQGIRELILIAQDTTDYGHDLGMKNGLARLLEALVREVPAVDWIRVLYMYPGYVTDELIEVMSGQPQIVHYLDLPLQHSHAGVLKRMKRPTNIHWVRRTIDKIRRRIPDLTFRTTFIVGHPGETEEAFQDLLDFVAEMRFDWVGVFKYSLERGTPGEGLGDPISREKKNERRERLMLLQQEISFEKNRSFIGKRLKVLVEGSAEGVSIGRSYRDAPEVDGMVLIEGEVPPGEMVTVRITAAMPYDLSGVVEGEYCDRSHS